MKNILDINDVKQIVISEYSRASDTTGSRTTVGEALERIQEDDALARTIGRIRTATESDQERLKKNLPSVTWSGEFERREANGIVAHSGLVVLDYDEMTTADARALKKQVAESPHVVAAFISPRASGLKVLMAVSMPKGTNHKDAYRTCKAYAHTQGWPELDTSGSDCSRLCYLSTDPKMYVADEVTALMAKPGPKREKAAKGETEEDRSAEELLGDLDKVVNGVELEDCEAMLTVLDPSCSYEDWMNIGMALHAQWGGSALEPDALQLFQSWSCGLLWHGDPPDNWQSDDDCEAKWDSFGKRGAGEDVTLRSLIKRAKDAGFQTGALLREQGTSEGLSEAKRKEIARADARMLKDALAAIAEASSVTELTGDTARKITEFELYDSSRETMIEAFQAKYKELSNGQKMTKKAVDELTAYNYSREVTKNGCPEWAAPYVFCREKEGAFVCVDTMSVTGTKAFNMCYSSHLITDVMKAQGKLHPYVLPSDLLVNADLVEKVHSTRYTPGEEPIFDGQDGQRMLNRWKPAKAETVDELVHDADESAACELWANHLQWLLGEEHGGMLLKFLAYIVQNPGERVRWAFLMKGPEGCGKTTIVNDLMSGVLGKSNVDVLDNSTLMYTQFNEWADSRQLCIVEEVYVEGRAKWDVMNILKPAITNEVLSIHPKGRPKYNADNVTSYIMSTNHADALPLAAGDRRYYVCETRWTGEEFITDLGGGRKAAKYFTALRAAARDYAGALRGWLLGVDLAGFDPNRAPKSAGKNRMMQMSKSDLQVAVEEIIADEVCATVCNSAIEIETLKGLLVDKGEQASGQYLGRLLRSMGYEPAGRYEIGPVKGRPGTVKSYWCVRREHLDAMAKTKHKAEYLRGVVA